MKIRTILTKNGKAYNDVTVEDSTDRRFDTIVENAFPNFTIYAKEENDIFADAKMMGATYSLHAIKVA
jgi:hypothetical protein